jgi:hypothetical protein
MTAITAMSEPRRVTGFMTAGSTGQRDPELPAG